MKLVISVTVVMLLTLAQDTWAISIDCPAVDINMDYFADRFKEVSDVASWEECGESE